MLATKLLPKFFKEVMTHIPTLALKSMDWKGLAKEIAPMATRLGRRHLDDDSLNSLKELDVEGLSPVKASLVNNYSSLTKEHKVRTGEVVLKLYFAQLKNPKGVALDLRPKHFRREDAKVRFAPNNVWFHFNEDFRLALCDLYQGFYHGREELFDSAMARIGLTSGLDAKEAQRLKSLFREHFGPGEQGQVKFEMEHFQESFYQLFKFFMDHEVALEKDFMFLGIYLVGLYMNLEELGVALDARSAFLDVFPAP